MAAKCELIGSAFKTTKLDVLVYPDSEEFGELPVEMIFRECSNAAESFHAKVIVQIGINVLKYFAESGAIALYG